MAIDKLWTTLQLRHQYPSTHLLTPFVKRLKADGGKSRSPIPVQSRARDRCPIPPTRVINLSYSERLTQHQRTSTLALRMT